MRIMLLAGLTVCVQLLAQSAPPRWGQLLVEGKNDEAKRLCVSMRQSTSSEMRVEAEKCLANVALATGSRMELSANDTGGGSLGEGYSPQAVDEALSHLNAGIQLAPLDRSLHFGRLHVLEVAGRYDAMAKAMDESIMSLKETTIDDWIQYAFELGNMGQAKGGIIISQVIVKHFPQDHQAIGNLGAFYMMSGDVAAALPYLTRAAQLAPNDPVDVWNVGWAYRKSDPQQADIWLKRALSIPDVKNDMPTRKCNYAKFVEENLHEEKRGCQLQRESCDVDDQTACAKRPTPKT